MFSEDIYIYIYIIFFPPLCGLDKTDIAMLKQKAWIGQLVIAALEAIHNIIMTPMKDDNLNEHNKLMVTNFL